MRWQLTIDCNDPARLVAFWSTALRYEVPQPPAGFATWNDWYRSVGVPDDELDVSGDGADRIVDPEGRGPTIWFQVVPEAKAGKNRLHLDIFVEREPGDAPGDRRRRVDARVASLVSNGAAVDHVVDEPEHERYFAVLRDLGAVPAAIYCTVHSARTRCVATARGAIRVRRSVEERRRRARRWRARS